METGDFLDIELRPAEQIARRILVLHAVVQRVLLDDSSLNLAPSDQDPDEALFDLRAALTVSGAEQELTSGERALISSPASRIPEDDRYDYIWSIEALCAILAATELIDVLPPPPELSDIRAVNLLFEEQEPNTGKLASAMHLPDDESAARTREIAELWFWRATAERAIRVATGAERQQLRSEIREVAAEAGDAGLIDVSPAGDFETGRGIISEWSDDDLAGFELASEARLRAMNWLCGFGETWEDTPLEV